MAKKKEGDSRPPSNQTDGSAGGSPQIRLGKPGDAPIGVVEDFGIGAVGEDEEVIEGVTEHAAVELDLEEVDDDRDYDSSDLDSDPNIVVRTSTPRGPAPDEIEEGVPPVKAKLPTRPKPVAAVAPRVAAPRPAPVARPKPVVALPKVARPKPVASSGSSTDPIEAPDAEPVKARVAKAPRVAAPRPAPVARPKPVVAAALSTTAPPPEEAPQVDEGPAQTSPPKVKAKRPQPVVRVAATVAPGDGTASKDPLPPADTGGKNELEADTVPPVTRSKAPPLAQPEDDEEATGGGKPTVVLKREELIGSAPVEAIVELGEDESDNLPEGSRPMMEEMADFLGDDDTGEIGLDELAGSNEAVNEVEPEDEELPKPPPPIAPIAARAPPPIPMGAMAPPGGGYTPNNPADDGDDSDVDEVHVEVPAEDAIPNNQDDGDQPKSITDAEVDGDEPEGPGGGESMNWKKVLGVLTTLVVLGALAVGAVGFGILGNSRGYTEWNSRYIEAANAPYQVSITKELWNAPLEINGKTHQVVYRLGALGDQKITEIVVDGHTYLLDLGSDGSVDTVYDANTDTEYAASASNPIEKAMVAKGQTQANTIIGAIERSLGVTPGTSAGGSTSSGDGLFGDI